MKLIDADALIMQMNDGPYNCPGDCGACETDEIIIDGRKLIACSAVTHTPTIDAIPVEWLNNVILTGDAEESQAAWKMLHKWNDEHFADIGKMQNL